MSFRLAGVHLFVLSAFALAEPLFDLLGKNAEFFGAAARPAGTSCSSR